MQYKVISGVLTIIFDIIFDIPNDTGMQYEVISGQFLL